jgi:Zn-dependent peptidase ImmA (M78 family)
MEADYLKARLEARKVLQANYVASAPVRVDELAKNYGLIILEAELDMNSTVSGFIDVKNKRIILNKKETENYKAFTIAHILGHYLLHRISLEQNPNTYAIVYRRPIGEAQDPLEKESNCFAAHLLVPNELLEKYKDYDTNTIAKIFGVPVEVIGLRKLGGLYGIS